MRPFKVKCDIGPPFRASREDAVPGATSGEASEVVEAVEVKFGLMPLFVLRMGATGFSAAKRLLVLLSEDTFAQ